MKRAQLAVTALILVAAALLSPPLPAHPSTAFTVNSTVDPGTGVCDAAECTLREAIQAANALPGEDTIAFNIPGAAPHTIAPNSGLPEITDPAVIDGTTEPDFAGHPIVEVSGAGAGSDASGLVIRAGDSSVRGLVINGFSGGGGIYLRENGGNVIEGNFIGTDVTGSAAVGNSGGVLVGGSSDNTIGGTTPAARNVLSGNDAGVLIGPGSLNNLVAGNFIGTDATGEAALGNRYGIYMVGTSANTIGGSSEGAGNVISANTNGIHLEYADDNTVRGNFIGTDVTGTVDLGNALVGVRLARSSHRNNIGGTSPGAGNVISGNGAGMAIAGYNVLNAIQGNLIGTDVTGTVDLGNATAGIGLGLYTHGTLIGGAEAGARNVISGNDGVGIFVDAQNGGANTIENNYIGTDIAGSGSLGNALEGIVVSNCASVGNMIGGSEGGAGNLIAHNGGAGISATAHSGLYPLENTIISNSIHSNAGLGIDLFPAGVTPNDPGDADTGANNLQNFPLLGLARSGGGGTAVHGTLSSAANTSFTLQFFANASCDPSGYGEGEVLAGSATLTTDNSGEVRFRVVLPVLLLGRQFITATVTDPDGNTSEFSRCVPVRGNPRTD